MTNFENYNYSKKSHFNLWKENQKLLYGEHISQLTCDLKVYQDLLVFAFIKENIPIGSKILDIGGGDSRILKYFANDYECWNIDKLEGIGSGPLTLDNLPYRLVKDYIGNFNEELPENYFDFVFSISALEHVGEDKNWHENICNDINRVLKPEGYSLHCFDSIININDNTKPEKYWYCGLIEKMLEKFNEQKIIIPFEQVSLDADLFTMSEQAYNSKWLVITKQSYKDFGQPFSYNVLWKKDIVIENITTKYPKISIVTPSFNQAEYLEETIKSVINQNYPNLEYVIIDGGSTDGSIEIIKKYEKHLKYWHSKPDNGQYFAINEGFKQTDGEIMAWINSDDKYHPRSFFKIAEVFNNNQGIEWICGRPTYMEGDGTIYDIHYPLPVWERNRFLEMKYDSPFIQQESTFWKRTLWERIGAELNTNYSLAADLELWISFFRYTSLYTLDAFIGAWRRHNSQKSNILRKKYVEEAENIINNELKNYKDIIIKSLPKENLIIEKSIEKNNQVLQKIFNYEYEENCWSNYRAEIFKTFKKALIDHKIGVLEVIIKEQKILSQKNILMFSIITPSYNQGKYLEQTIKSVLKQNFPLYEYIIIDGGSDDGSVEIIKKYERYLSYWVSEKDSGQSEAINKGFNLAIGDIIGWINSDDWYEENTLEQVNKFFIENPDKNIVMGNCNLVNGNGVVFDIVINSERGFEELSKYWIGRSIPTQPAIFFRRKMLEEYGLLDESLQLAMDYDLWMRFSQNNRFYHINQVFANYRFHSKAKGGYQNWEKFVPEWKKVYEKYIKTNSPLISVIIPCYNYGRYLTEAVESVVNQTYKNFEIIIVNDGSTDNTKEIAETLIKKYKETQIILINQENSGHPSISRNNGIKDARGKYILPLDADDMLEPFALEKYSKEAEKIEGDFVIFGWLQNFGILNSIWNSYPFEKNQILRRNMVPASAMFTKTIWKKNNGYKKIGYEDWEFWINALANEVAFINVPDVLTYYRTTNEDSRVKNLIAKHEKHIAEIILEHKNLYEDLEIEWAQKYLTNNSKYSLVKQKNKYLSVAAIWIFSYQEHYTTIDVKIALDFLKNNKFEISKGFKQKENNPKYIPITAIISAYNEGDIIYHVIKDLVEQDIQVYFIDHNSTDNTVEQVAKFLGRGVIKIERFPQDSEIKIEENIYSWRYILKRKEEISQMLGDGWYIHADADEFREAPFENLSLREGIEKVDTEGYNAINFKIYDFKPTNNNFKAGEDVRDYIKYYSKNIHQYNKIQIKCWKNFGQQINLWQSGGHSVEFLGRNVYPQPFILRHYAVRSQEHGLRKIFNERKKRYDNDERKAQWHQHYDVIKDEKHNFVENENDLFLYEKKQAIKEIFEEYKNENKINDYFRYNRPEVQQLVNKNAKKILDVGCGAGVMASELKNNLSAEVWGVEYVSEIAELAKERLDRVLIGSIEDNIKHLPDNYFDSIIFADVLEHLANPESVLKMISKKLKNDGEIIASIPNVRHWSVLLDLIQGNWTYQEAGILDKTHLRFYTKNSINTLFNTAGLKIIQIGETNYNPPDINIKNVWEKFKQSVEGIGLNVESLAKEGNNYQYLIKAVISKSNIDIIVPLFNNVNYTEQFFHSLPPQNNNVIFIDNNSTDGTSKYLSKLQENSANIKIIANNKNLGFPKAINQGILKSLGDYILIANNDIIITPGSIERMLEIAESDPSIGIVAPISNIASGVQFDKNAKYSTIEEMYQYASKVKKDNAGRIFEYPRVAFLLTLIKKELIEKIGGLDERFSPGNYEDDDFCLRTQLAGYKIVIAEDVFIHHFGSESFKKIGEDSYKELLKINRNKFVEKWGATPEEIWLENKSVKKRNLNFPLGENPETYLERAQLLIQDNDIKNAINALEECIDNYDDLITSNITKDIIINFLNKLK